MRKSLVTEVAPSQGASWPAHPFGLTTDPMRTKLNGNVGAGAGGEATYARRQGMTDKELLEKAAKAAGIVIARQEMNPLTFWVMYAHRHGARPWNPLEDDGDALRLAVDLRLDVCTTGTRIDVTRGSVHLQELIAADGRHASARRAIVRAAAEIGSKE